MLRRSLSAGLATVALVAMLGCGENSPKGTNSNAGGPQAVSGDPLYAVKPYPKPSDTDPKAPASVMVLDGGRILVIDKQDVPSQRDGVVLDIKVHEGQYVTKNQLLAQLDERLAEADEKIKIAKREAAIADEDASKKTRDESHNRYMTQLDLWKKRATTEEDLRAAKLTWDRYISEASSKGSAIRLSEQELEQAKVVREMHKLSSTANGIVKVIYKKPGESVKNLEPVFQVINTDRLRVEALADEQVGRILEEALKKNKELEVIVEPNITEGPMDEPFRGHLQEVTSVAVSTDVDLGKAGKSPLIVSGSDDATVRVWKRGQRREVAILEHGAPVKAVACSPMGSPKNLLLSGAADGKGRLWDLTKLGEKPLELKEAHRGAITCVAFTPDGKSCATGGDDREIRIWDTATGELRYKLPNGHRGAITSLTFTPQGLLVSAGRDNTIRRWEVREKGAEQKKAIDKRTGDVASLGVSPDGVHMLYDQGKVLRVLTVDGGLNEGEIRASSGASNFTTFATFSPDSQLLLTTGSTDGQLQLWFAPAGTHRGCELRQYVSADRSPVTAAAFSQDFTPENRFAVTGNKDRRVYVWPVPAPSEYDPKAEGYAEHRKMLTGKITFVDPVSETSGHQVRTWAELENKKLGLLPGGTATLVITPK